MGCFPRRSLQQRQVHHHRLVVFITASKLLRRDYYVDCHLHFWQQLLSRSEVLSLAQPSHHFHIAHESEWCKSTGGTGRGAMGIRSCVSVVRDTYSMYCTCLVAAASLQALEATDDSYGEPAFLARGCSRVRPRKRILLCI